MKAKKKLDRHGTNIRAPRLFEDGERVFFIQKIYGLSMCFGQGVIQRTLDLPTGYATIQRSRIQYLIKGSRLFFHEGRKIKDKGTYATWLGSSTIVIVPQSLKARKWLRDSIRSWKLLVDRHDHTLTQMRLI